MSEKENPQEGQDLLDSMSELYNAGEEEIEAEEIEIDEEVEEVEDDETLEDESIEETAEAEEVEEPELDPLQPNDLWEPHIKEMFPSLPREVQEFLLNTTTNWQTGYNTKFQELANERRQLEPIQQTFQDPILSQYLGLQGWQPSQAVQVFGQHMKNILTNPKAGYQTLMQALGHDPATLFNPEDEQYIDPAVSQANQRIAQLERERAQELQRRQAEEVQRAQQELIEFANKKNEQGNLAHPRFNELQNELMQIFAAMPHLSVEQAYRMAEVQNPLPQDHVSVSTQAASPQQIKRATAAKKTVKSKQSTQPKTPSKKLSIDDELKMAYRAGAGV